VRGTKRGDSGERGASLVETLVVLALAGVALAAGTNTSIDWMAREEMRSSVYSVQTYLQTARLQAVSRNRSCQFRVDASTRRIEVLDLNNPLSPTDDILLSQTTLSPKVSFARPDSGSPITLGLSSGTTYQATFTPDGIVTSGVGTIAILGGTRYDRIDLYAAGGTKIWRWDGASWAAGW
jgi:Tfp pilus assembly protein FimT